jgi:hypothetical protein
MSVIICLNEGNGIWAIVKSQASPVVGLLKMVEEGYTYKKILMAVNSGGKYQSSLPSTRIATRKKIVQKIIKMAYINAFVMG